MIAKLPGFHSTYTVVIEDWTYKTTVLLFYSIDEREGEVFIGREMKEDGHDMSGSLSAAGRGTDRWAPIASVPIAGIIRATPLHT